MMETEAMPSDVVSSELGRQFVVDNRRLQSLQKRFALATILLPFVGTLAALGLWLYRPISSSEIWPARRHVLSDAASASPPVSTGTSRTEPFTRGLRCAPRSASWARWRGRAR